jgi:hypothetical protein
MALAQKKTNAIDAGSLRIKPGCYTVHDATSVTGGLSYKDREYNCPICEGPVEEKTIGESDDDGKITKVSYYRCATCDTFRANDNSYRVKISSVKEMDDVKLYKEGTSLGNKARGYLEKYCTHTAVGWIVESENIEPLCQAIDAMQPAVDSFNRRALFAGSQRRVYVGVATNRLEVDAHGMASELARTVRDRITALRDVLRAGDISSLGAVFKRVSNLDKFAVGMQARSITNAIERAKAARKELKAKVREGQEAVDVGKTLSLGELDSCLGLFAELKAPSAPGA